MDKLLAEGQSHLFAQWPAPGERDEDKQRLLAQLRHLDASYAGGLAKYIQNARELLKDSKEGAAQLARLSGDRAGWAPLQAGVVLQALATGFSTVAAMT